MPRSKVYNKDKEEPIKIRSKPLFGSHLISVGDRIIVWDHNRIKIRHIGIVRHVSNGNILLDDFVGNGRGTVEARRVILSLYEIGVVRDRAGGHYSRNRTYRLPATADPTLADKVTVYHKLSEENQAPAPRPARRPQAAGFSFMEI